MEGVSRFKGFEPLARRYAALREKKPFLEKAQVRESSEFWFSEKGVALIKLMT